MIYKDHSGKNDHRRPTRQPEWLTRKPSNEIVSCPVVSFTDVLVYVPIVLAVGMLLVFSVLIMANEQDKTLELERWEHVVQGSQLEGGTPVPVGVVTGVEEYSRWLRVEATRRMHQSK